MAGTVLMKISCYRGALLTPKEMEDLTESWKPYRSIGKFWLVVDSTISYLYSQGVYYMWSLAEVTE
jgi:DNA-3-methyladenine glycosylase II